MKRLTPASLTMIMFVVVGGLITAYIAKELLATEAPTAQVRTRNVPMALADLTPGTVITAAHVGAGEIAVADLRPAMLLDTETLIGRVVKEPIPAATPIFSQQLYLPGEFPPLDVGKGMRAVSVSLADNESMVDGLVRPGQYVDVHWTPENVDTSDRRFRGGLTMTLFKGVKILAMNRSLQAGAVAQGGNSVTFELTAEQANIMILARERGDVTLTYTPEGKGTGVVAVSREDRATLDELLGLDPVNTHVIEAYRGTARTTLEFQGRRRVGQDTVPVPTTNDDN